MSNSPMDVLHQLKKRIQEEIDHLGVTLLRMVIIPTSSGPDMISCTFGVKPEAVKSTEEIEKDELDDAFTALVGGFEVEVDEHGNAKIEGSGELEEDEESAAERAVIDERARDAAEQIIKMLQGEDEDDDE